MSNALEDAEMKPEDIDYINVHGTSTPVGDLSEVKAIQGVFGDHAYKLNLRLDKVDDRTPPRCNRRLLRLCSA